MATQSSLAFQDDFTTPHGAAYFVSVDPVFDEQVRPSASSPRPLFCSRRHAC